MSDIYIYMEKIFNKKLGNLGEDIAAKYLEGKGYKIVERNCRNKWGEIDLVADKKRELVFVEVKTRSGEQFGTPEDSLNKNKIQRLIRNAQAYMARRDGIVPPRHYRIDAVCIVLDEKNQTQRIEHYENITN